MTDEELQEYTCPECGSAFPEGSEKCPECGLVFDWSEETDYICPDCGATVHGEAGECPECGAQFVHEHAPEGGYPEERTIDAMLDAAVAETLVMPPREEPDVGSEQPAASEGEAGESPQGTSAAQGEPTDATDEAAQTSGAEGEVGEAGEAAEAGEAGEEEQYEEIPVSAKSEPREPRTPPSKRRPKPSAAKPQARRYAGGFTKVGLVFVILSGIALVLTIVALRWDSIAHGSHYETIGTMQSMVIMMGIAGFVVCALVSVWDLLRGARAVEQ